MERAKMHAQQMLQIHNLFFGGLYLKEMLSKFTCKFIEDTTLTRRVMKKKKKMNIKRSLLKLNVCRAI